MKISKIVIYSEFPVIMVKNPIHYTWELSSLIKSDIPIAVVKIKVIFERIYIKLHFEFP